jgi:hypothetical protein
LPEVGLRVPARERVSPAPRALRLMWQSTRSCVLLIAAIGVTAFPVFVHVAPAAAGAEPQALAQFTNKLDADDGVQLAALYVTASEGGGSEWGQSELSWTIARLPCPGGSYRFISTEWLLDSSATHVSEARIKVLSAELPRGMRCNTRVPPGFAQGSTVVTVAPARRDGEAEPPTNEFSSGGTQIKSFSSCMMFSELCTGRFRFDAYFSSPSGDVVIQYRFEVTRVTSATGTAGSMPVNKADIVNAHGIPQCPTV